MNYQNLPLKTVCIDVKNSPRPFHAALQSVGHGGINTRPLPERVVQGLRKLRVPRIRTFIQEYFNVYPEHGVFDFSLLDPYLESLHRTGADIVAALSIKPPVLFPRIDETVVMPNDPEEWKTVVKALVHRYSIERPYLTHWEIGNEVDIGEIGGCPYRMADGKAYFDFYRLTAEAVLEAFPAAKVGGPGLSNSYSEILPEFVRCCAENGTRLDFISWHTYNNDFSSVREQIRRTRDLLTGYYGADRPRILVTEYGPAFDRISLPEQAFSGYRVVNVAGLLLTAEEEQLDESYYYHVWDQVFYDSEFASFFADPYIMQKHWNEVPHRFGMFSVDEQVRPAYFVYRLFRELGSDRLTVTKNPDHIWLCPVRRQDGSVSVMVVNGSEEDEAVELRFSGLSAGEVWIENYRLGDEKRWDEETLELIPVEKRTSYVWENYNCHLYSPAQTVSVLRIVKKAES